MLSFDFNLYPVSLSVPATILHSTGTIVLPMVALSKQVGQREHVFGSQYVHEDAAVQSLRTLAQTTTMGNL